MINRFMMMVFLLSLTACIGGKSPPSQFYLLEPIKGAGGVGTSNATGRPVIALSPVRIPQYVDRPQIVSAAGKNTYRLSETNRWAERLDDNIARVLVQNLGLLVPADVVLSNASALAKLAKFKVSVTLLEFHVDPQGQAILTAQWNVSRDDEVVASRQAGYREPASVTDYAVMAGALNECLNRLSRDLAADLQRLVGVGAL